MSAGRAAARNKPVIVIKSGRASEGARAAASHTGALAGADEVYDAAFRRAGMLRVNQIDELFDAAETLARSHQVRGDRLLIVTNGGGPGVMATDALVSSGGRLAELSADTRGKLVHLLPATWSGANPRRHHRRRTGGAVRRRASRLARRNGREQPSCLALAHGDRFERERGPRRSRGCRPPPERTVLTSWFGGGGRGAGASRPERDGNRHLNRALRRGSPAGGGGRRDAGRNRRAGGGPPLGEGSIGSALRLADRGARVDARGGITSARLPGASRGTRRSR